MLLVCFALFSCGRGTEATVDGAEIYWESSGNGPALVLIHGARRDTTDWRNQVAAFERDYRVIALDLQGHGQSGPLAEVANSSIPWGGSVIPFADAIEAVRVEAGIDRMVLVGHSLGGWVIGEYMVHTPQYVAGVVLVDTILDGGPPNVERTMTPEDSFEVPALYVLGVDGSVLRRGRQPERLLQRTPRGRIEVMPDVGHDVMLDNPEEFNRLLRDFLLEIDF